MVVATAISQESPKWDRTIGVAPALLGRDFPSQIHGLFDFIGYIDHGWSLNDDGTTSPPRVSFHAENGAYLARSSGKLSRVKGSGPLNFSKLLQFINQDSQKDKPKEVPNETPMSDLQDAPKLL